MNKAQAKRIAMAVKGAELALGETPSCISEALSEEDQETVASALQSLGWDMLRRAGFDEVPSPEAILKTILGGAATAA